MYNRVAHEVVGGGGGAGGGSKSSGQRSEYHALHTASASMEVSPFDTRGRMLELITMKAWEGVALCR